MAESKEELQKKYIEFQVMQQQASELQEQLQRINEDLANLVSTYQGLDEIEKTKKGTKILSPLNSGIFVSALLDDNKEIILNAGADVAVRKTIPEAKEIINAQLSQLKQLHNNFSENLNAHVARAVELQEELKKLAK